MPRIKAEVGSVVMLVSDEWENRQSAALAPGQLGEITGVGPRDEPYPYDVDFGVRKLPLDRREFTTL